MPSWKVQTLNSRQKLTKNCYSTRRSYCATATNGNQKLQQTFTLTTYTVDLTQPTSFEQIKRIHHKNEIKIMKQKRIIRHFVFCTHLFNLLLHSLEQNRCVPRGWESSYFGSCGNLKPTRLAVSSMLRSPLPLYSF